MREKEETNIGLLADFQVTPEGLTYYNRGGDEEFVGRVMEELGPVIVGYSFFWRTLTGPEARTAFSGDKITCPVTIGGRKHRFTLLDLAGEPLEHRINWSTVERLVERGREQNDQPPIPFKVVIAPDRQTFLALDNLKNAPPPSEEVGFFHRIHLVDGKPTSCLVYDAEYLRAVFEGRPFATREHDLPLLRRYLVHELTDIYQFFDVFNADLAGLRRLILFVEGFSEVVAAGYNKLFYMPPLDKIAQGNLLLLDSLRRGSGIPVSQIEEALVKGGDEFTETLENPRYQFAASLVGRLITGLDGIAARLCNDSNLREKFPDNAVQVYFSLLNYAVKNKVGIITATKEQVGIDLQDLAYNLYLEHGAISKFSGRYDNSLHPWNFRTLLECSGEIF